MHVRARACEWVRCQSKRRLLFHLYSQSEIRGRRTALHSLQPNITLSLCWAHFWRGTPFYPRNQTGMTHSIWSPALFFFFLVGFFEQSELSCVQLILLTFASKNTTGVVLELLKHPASLHCGPLWILECCRRPNTRTRVWVRQLKLYGGFLSNAFAFRAFVGWGGLSITREMPQLSGGGGGGDPELCATDEMIPFKDEGDPQKEQIFAEISHSEEEGDLAEIKSSLVNESEISPNSNNHDVSTPLTQVEGPAPSPSNFTCPVVGKSGFVFRMKSRVDILTSVLWVCVCVCVCVWFKWQSHTC